MDEASWFRTEEEPKPARKPLMHREAMDFVDGLSETVGERVYDEAYDLARASERGEVTLNMAHEAAEFVIQSWKNTPVKPLG